MSTTDEAITADEMRGRLMTRPRVTRERAHRSPSVAPLYRAKAPLRVSFAGGGTDVTPFPEREGGLVLSATINRYAHGIMRPRTDGRVSLESLDLGTALEYGAHDPIHYDGQLDLVKAAIQRVARSMRPAAWTCSSTLRPRLGPGWVPPRR